MKKTLLALVVILIVGIAVAYAQNPGMMGGQGWNYCPYCGQYVGQGMMGGGMMGRGMMGIGYGQQQPQQYQQPQYQQPQKPLEEKDAKAILENYLTNMRNPNLKLGKIKDAGNTFEAEIMTKDNSLVDKIVVDKSTGWMRSAY